MKVSYYPSQSNSRPLDIEVTSSAKYVYIRRNIQEKHLETENGDPYVLYVYEEALLTKDEFESYKSELLYKLFNSQDNTEEFDRYLERLNTPVEFTNGHSYKPKWADVTYFNLLQKGTAFPEMFPIKIYDSTGLDENAVDMTFEELRQLSLFLEEKKEELFLQYKKELQLKEQLDPSRVF